MNQKDYTLAHICYNLVGASGDKKASEWHDDVAKQMTSAQIAEAQRLAREWQPKPWEELQGQLER